MHDVEHLLKRVRMTKQSMEAVPAILVCYRTLWFAICYRSCCCTFAGIRIRSEEAQEEDRKEKDEDIDGNVVVVIGVEAFHLSRHRFRRRHHKQG
jgi:hypothetical protein